MNCGARSGLPVLAFAMLALGCATQPAPSSAPIKPAVAAADAQPDPLVVAIFATCERRYGARTPEALSCAIDMVHKAFPQRAEQPSSPSRSIRCHPDFLGGYRCDED